MTKHPSAVRRLAIAAGLLIAVLVACGREITGPVSNSVSAFRRFASLAFEPRYETALPAPALHAALTQVAFERVRITLRREDGSIALDTVVLFPAGATELTLTLNVPLPPSASSAGVPLSLNLGYVNAAGDTVFKGGPIPVTVIPTVAGGTPPPAVPVQVPVHYTGTGAAAVSVAINPKVVSGLAGQATTFTAQALSSGGQPIPGTPIVFASSNSDVVTVNQTTGAATFVGRGTAKVYALLLTGPADSATVTVTLPASQLVLSSGGGQVAAAGATLPAPIVARVLASDGVGVGGTTVTFAASGGGTVTPASAVSDASGNVSTQWKLGTTAGPQTLTMTATGLSGSPMTVNATAQAVVPTKLTMLAQPASGTAGVALPTITVAAQDVGGNTVTTFSGDVSVAIGTNPGSAALTGTTIAKAVNGVATFSDLKLNRPGTAYTLVFSSAGLSPVASSPFNITAGAAAQLVFGPMPAAIDAGIAIAPAVTVTAQDAVGNPVTTFTGSVTLALGSNPGSSTLGGTLTRAAVGGVATFNDLTIRKSGSPYTLTASATGLTGATSTGFTVAPGAPAALNLVSGGGQSAASGSALNPIVVRLRDAYDNGIAGAVISFVVTGGGGSLSSASATTDATGTASVVWTIGAGPQTMNASFGALSPLTVTATSTSTTLTWTGATSTAWTTASNWTPAFVPTASDVATIPVTANPPTISAAASVLSVTVAPGATLTNNAVLTVNGSVDAGTTITGSGTVILAGTSGLLKGVINQQVIVSGAAYTLNGTTVTGSLEINSTGKLTVGGQSLTVNGSLSTAASGRLAMTNPSDLVTVTGNTFFQGGSENGFLTAGTLVAQGNFTTAGANFGASGSHTLKLSGAVSPQTLTFTSPVGGQGINHLTFENAAAKTMSGTPQIIGDVSIAATSAPVDGAVSARIGGNFTDATIFPDSGGNPNPLGGWRVANTEFFGSNKTINSKFITSNVTVSGTLQFAGCTSCMGERLVSVLSSDYGYVQINGNLTVSGTGALLKLNGNSVDVYGDFATASGGVIDMTSSADYLYVDGSAVFGGGSEVGKLTLGTLEVVQDFTQTGAVNSFAPSVDFYTYIGEYYYGGGNLRSLRARSARAAEALTKLTPAQEAIRSKRTKQIAALRAQHDRRSIRLQRRAAAYAARGLAAPSTDPMAMQNSAVEKAVWRRTSKRSYSGTSNITFANPSSSFFGVLYLSGPEFLLGSNVTVAGRLETGESEWHEVYSNSATPRNITSHGADVRNLGFDNVSWTLLDGSEVWSLDYVEFDNMDPTADQFTIARTADELVACDCTSYYELYYWSFYTTPTTGHYIKATDTNGGPNVLQLYMDEPSPAVHGGHVSTSGGAKFLNWMGAGVFVSQTDGSALAHFKGGYDASSFDCSAISASCSEPRNPAVNPQGTLVAVPFRFSNRVAFFDPRVGNFVSSVADAAFDEPYAVAFTSDGTELWVANKKGGGSSVGSVSIINVATMTVVANLTSTEFVSPEGITIAGGKAFIANRQGGTVTIVSVATRAILGNITVGGDPRDVAATPDGQYVYASSDAGYVKRIKISDGTTTQINVTGASRNMTISPDGAKIYVATQNDAVSVIDVATSAVSQITFSGASGTYGVALLKDGSRGFVTDVSTGKLYAFDPATGLESFDYPFPLYVGGGPRGIVAW